MSYRPLGSAVVLLAPALGIVLTMLAVVLTVHVMSKQSVDLWRLVPGVLSACRIAAATAVLGSIPVAVAWHFKKQWLLEASSLGMALRFAGTLAAVLFAATVWKFTEAHFLLAVVGFYVIGLIVETIVTTMLANGILEE